MFYKQTARSPPPELIKMQSPSDVSFIFLQLSRWFLKIPKLDPVCASVKKGHTRPPCITTLSLACCVALRKSVNLSGHWLMSSYTLFYYVSGATLACSVQSSISTLNQPKTARSFHPREEGFESHHVELFPDAAPFPKCGCHFLCQRDFCRNDVLDISI